MRGSCTVVLLAAFCLNAAAQTGPLPASPERPRLWVWTQDAAPCGVDLNPLTDFQTPMLKMYANPQETGTQAGARAAAYIRDHTRESAWTSLNGTSACDFGPQLRDPNLSPTLDNQTGTNTICISIQNFGAPVSDTGDWAGSDLPFFHQAE